KLALSGLPQHMQEHGLVPIPSRATNPAITIFQSERYGTERRAPEYVELLVAPVGHDDRDAVEIAPGLGAQTLRYLDLSFAQVRHLSCAQVPFVCDLGALTIPVPSPASYLLAKALVFPQRKHGEKRDGDCAYLYWLARVTRP